MARTYSDEGIVLARRNYGEGDRIIILFSKKHGKLALLAKGVRKPKSRKRGHIEVFGRIKFSAVKQSGLDLMTEAEIVESFERIRKNLKKVAVAYYFMEVVGRVTREEERHGEIFVLLKDYLQKLADGANTRELRLAFVTDTLVTLGFWPHDKPLANPDAVMEEVIERQISSSRVGKKLLS